MNTTRKAVTKAYKKHHITITRLLTAYYATKPPGVVIADYARLQVKAALRQLIDGEGRVKHGR